MVGEDVLIYIVPAADECDCESLGGGDEDNLGCSVAAFANDGVDIWYEKYWHVPRSHFGDGKQQKNTSKIIARNLFDILFDNRLIRSQILLYLIQVTIIT